MNAIRDNTTNTATKHPTVILLALISPILSYSSFRSSTYFFSICFLFFMVLVFNCCFYCSCSAFLIGLATALGSIRNILYNYGLTDSMYIIVPPSHNCRVWVCSPLLAFARLTIPLVLFVWNKDIVILLYIKTTNVKSFYKGKNNL